MDTLSAAPPPTIRDRVNQWLAGDHPSFARGQFVDGLVGRSGRKTGLIDFTPLGIPFNAYEAGRSLAQGHYGDAALSGLAVAPNALLGSGARMGGKILKALRPAADEAASAFRTSAGAIAADHEADVSRIMSEAFERADANTRRAIQGDPLTAPHADVLMPVQSPANENVVPRTQAPTAPPSKTLAPSRRQVLGGVAALGASAAINPLLKGAKAVLPKAAQAAAPVVDDATAAIIKAHQSAIDAHTVARNLHQGIASDLAMPTDGLFDTLRDRIIAARSGSMQAAEDTAGALEAHGPDPHRSKSVIEHDIEMYNESADSFAQDALDIHDDDFDREYQQEHHEGAAQSHDDVITAHQRAIEALQNPPKPGGPIAPPADHVAPGYNDAKAAWVAQPGGQPMPVEPKYMDYYKSKGYQPVDRPTHYQGRDGKPDLNSPIMFR